MGLGPAHERDLKPTTRPRKQVFSEETNIKNDAILTPI
jgi:hypothetical protein